MSSSHITGPFVVVGANAGGASGTDSNSSAGPSIFAHGVGLLDKRFYLGPGGQPGAPLLQGWGPGAGNNMLVVDAVPSTIATANIAALANAVSGVAMALVSVTGAGITVGVGINNAATGAPVKGLLAIDGAAGLISYGSIAEVAFYDPAKAIARAVSITGVINGAGGAFKVSGYDIYGFPMTETITAAAGVATTNGKKAFKYIASVVPQFADAHTYSVGTTDIYGFPLYCKLWGYAGVAWNSADLTANTGFVAPDATVPATATTGDPRGTYAAQSASDGTKSLQMYVSLPPSSLGLAQGAAGSITGVTPA